MKILTDWLRSLDYLKKYERFIYNQTTDCFQKLLRLANEEWLLFSKFQYVYQHCYQ